MPAFSMCQLSTLNAMDTFLLVQKQHWSLIHSPIKDREWGDAREYKENRLSCFGKGMNKQKKRKANRERKKSRLDTVSVMMRRKRRHNRIARISECCIQRGPLTQSIVMDSTYRTSTIPDRAFFICLYVVHGNNNIPNYWTTENLFSILNSHLFFPNSNNYSPKKLKWLPRWQKREIKWK